MIPRTMRNYSRLQTPCACCGHPEWDHYMTMLDGLSACDSGGCKCPEFLKPDVS